MSDNSPEETAGLARSLLDGWPGPGTYLGNETNIGELDNLNQCVARAAGGWVLILHDDDYLLPGAVEAIVATIRSTTPADHALLFGTDIVDAEGHVLRRQVYERDRRLTPAEALRRVLTDSSFVRIPAIVVRSAAYEGTGPFAATARQANDFDMWIRLFAAGGVRLIPVTTSAYMVHAAALTTGMFNREYIAILGERFDAAIALGVLTPAVVRRAQRDWFHQFLLAGAYRSIKEGDGPEARKVMSLFDEPTVRSLGRSRRWLPIKVGMEVIVRLPKPIAQSVARLLGVIDRDVKHWILDPERA